MTFNLMDIKNELRKSSLLPDVEGIRSTDNLFSLGALDSIAILHFVTLLEEKFDIVFDYQHITLKNFNSLEAVAKMLSEKYGVALDK